MDVVVVDRRELSAHPPPFGFSSAVRVVECQDIPVCIFTNGTPPSAENACDGVPLDLEASATVDSLGSFSPLSKRGVGPVSFEIIVLPAEPKPPACFLLTAFRFTSQRRCAKEDGQMNDILDFGYRLLAKGEVSESGGKGGHLCLCVKESAIG